MRRVRLRKFTTVSTIGVFATAALLNACSNSGGDDAAEGFAGSPASGGRKDGGEASSGGRASGGASQVTSGGSAGDPNPGGGSAGEAPTGSSGSEASGGSSAGGTGAAQGGEPNSPDPADSTLGRLLIADADPENPRMMVLDLDTGEVVAEFPTLGTVRAYSSSPWSGYAWSNQRVPGVVEIVASGIAVEDGVVEKTAPYVLSERFEGPLPTHWVSHDDWIVSFNDGDGSLDFALQESLGGTRPLFSVAHTGKAHHGVALISHGNVFATIPHELADTGDPGPGSAYILPIGVSVRRIATPDTIVKVGDVELRSEECPLLHGEAANDDVVAFGCGDGALLAEREDGVFAFRKLVNPAGTPEGQRIGSLRAAEGVDTLVGNWGNGFAIIPYKSETPEWIQVDLGTANRGFDIDPRHKALVVLGGNGSLYKFDAETGAPLDAPLSNVIPEVTAGQATPGLTLGDDRAFVADPRSGKVVEVILGEWTRGRTLSIGGQPYSAAAFGAHSE